MKEFIRKFSEVYLLLLCGVVMLQYFIGVTVLAMVPELPEIVNGIQFALQNNISLRSELFLHHFSLFIYLFLFS